MLFLIPFGTKRGFGSSHFVCHVFKCVTEVVDLSNVQTSYLVNECQKLFEYLRDTKRSTMFLDAKSFESNHLNSFCNILSSLHRAGLNNL